MSKDDQPAEPVKKQTPAVLPPSKEGDDDSPPAEMITRVEQFMGMMQIGSRKESMFEKLDSGQISQVIENAEKDSERQYVLDQKQENSRRFYTISAIVVVIAICWMFLSYDKTEHIDAVISALVGLLGGYGLGQANSKNAG